MKIMKEHLHSTVTNRVSVLWKFESYGKEGLEGILGRFMIKACFHGFIWNNSR